MAASTYHSIIVEQVNRGGVKFKQALAASANIVPGDLIERTSATQVDVQTGGGGTVLARKMVALESPTADTSSGSAAIDIAYASGDTVHYYTPQPGDVLYMWLAAGENASVQSVLGNHADNGDLEVLTLAAGTFTQGVVGFAKEAVNNSAGTVAARILVEIA